MSAKTTNVKHAKLRAEYEYEYSYTVKTTYFRPTLPCIQKQENNRGTCVTCHVVFLLPRSQLTMFFEIKNSLADINPDRGNRQLCEMLQSLQYNAIYYNTKTLYWSLKSFLKKNKKKSRCIRSPNLEKCFGNGKFTTV